MKNRQMIELVNREIGEFIEANRDSNGVLSLDLDEVYPELSPLQECKEVQRLIQGTAMGTMEMGGGRMLGGPMGQQMFSVIAMNMLACFSLGVRIGEALMSGERASVDWLEELARLKVPGETQETPKKKRVRRVKKGQEGNETPADRERGGA